MIAGANQTDADAVLATDSLRDLTVLYVEDDPIVRDQFSKFLSRRAGAVHAVENGALGLELFARLKPDLVITDILMPVLDGLSMTEKIKESHPNIPVVVTSAHSEANRLFRAIEVGVDHYVVKPIDLGAMRATLARCARAIHADREIRTAAAVMDVTGEAVVVLDGAGAIVTVNPAFHAITGWNGPLAGRDIVDLLSPDPAPEWTRCRAHGGSWQGEATLRRADGSRFYAVGAHDTVKDETGKVIRSVLIFADVSERRQIEEQLRQAQKMETVGQLTGGIAHDFNNLLGVIHGNAELLMEGPDAALAEPILRAATRGAQLTKSLLAFSRHQPLHPRPVDLAELVANLKTMLRRTLTETIEIETILPPDLWPVHADPALVETSLLNLVLNSRDAMPEGGLLTVRCENVARDGQRRGIPGETPDGDGVLLSVTDTGTGMSDLVRARAFEPFFTTKDVGQGSGLGLAMVYGFARQSGGHVTIDSLEGHGTTVGLFLPRAVEAAASETAASPDVVPKTLGERILVIEDNADLRALVMRMLQGMGYRPHGLATAATAMEAVDLGAFDLVLTDVVLPDGMSGPKFVSTARLIYPDLKALFMSGYAAAAGTRSETLDTPVLSKPFRRQELATALRAALDGGI